MGWVPRLPKWLLLLFAIAAAASISFWDSYNGTINSGDKSYKEIELRVDAKILPDGSMVVSETRILDFKGEFSRFRRQIPHQGFSEMVEVKVSEPNLPYTLTYAPTGRPEGRYAISRSRLSGIDNDIIEFFFKVNDQKRTFIIEYRLTDVVKVHNDVAELYWKFIGAGRSLPIESMTVNLTLPQGAPEDTVRVWGHGPLKGVVKKISASQLLWQTANLPPNRFLEGRATFPSSLIPEAKKLTNKVVLPEILAEEQRWADQRADEQRMALYEVAGALTIALIGVWAAFAIYSRMGRKYKTPLEVEYYRELPGNYSPAEAGCLVENGRVKPQAVVATFMDLARRGYLRMEPAHNSHSEDILIFQLKPSGEELAPHEHLLLEFFFTKVGRMQNPVWFSTLKSFRQADPEATSAFSSAFQGSVKVAAKSQGFWEASNLGKSYSGIGSGMGLVGAMIFYVMEWYFLAAAFTVVLISMFIAFVRCRDLTPYGQQQFDLWQAFRRFLKDFSNLDRAQIPQLILWEHYLVYAVVLGVAKEVIKQLPIVFPQVNDPNSQFGPYWGGMYHSGYGSDGILRQGTFSGLTTLEGIVDSMDTTWSTMYSAVSSSGSSGSGGGGDGGGFSGGGGGGGGGGSGDAD